MPTLMIRLKPSRMRTPPSGGMEPQGVVAMSGTRAGSVVAEEQEEDQRQTAVKEGIMYGPLLKSEIPWDKHKVSPMTVRAGQLGQDSLVSHIIVRAEGKS